MQISEYHIKNKLLILNIKFEGNTHCIASIDENNNMK